MLAACTYVGEKPTREAIVTYYDECKAAGVRADFMAKFGGNFAGLNLSGVEFAEPYVSGLETNLGEANFRGANLRGAQFGIALLDRANFEDADLRGAQFNSASLCEANLKGAKVDDAIFQNAYFLDANAAGVDFSEAVLAGSTFYSANLARASFRGLLNGNAPQTFQNANLAEADLSHADLYGVSFANANLRGAQFVGAKLNRADFSGADLAGANFDKADLALADFRHAQGLTDEEHRILMQRSHLAERNRDRAITRFLESLWFPLLLAAAIFPAAWALRRFSSRSAAADTSSSPERMQFTLASLLGGMLVVAALVGVGLWTIVGAYSLMMVIAAFLMIDTVLHYPAQREPALRMLKVAAGCLATCAWVAGIGWISFWTSFEPHILLATFFLLGTFVLLFGPIIAMVVGSIFAGSSGSFSRRAALGFVVWQLGLTLANLYLVMHLLVADFAAP